MISNINSFERQNSNYKNKNLIIKPAFQGTNLNKQTRLLNKFIKSQEDLSTTRFIQGTMTNWFPKAVFSRSFVDFSEFTFLEFLESGLFFFFFPFLGEKLYRNKLFKKVQPKNLKETISKNVVKSLDEIEKSKFNLETKNRLKSTKAGILLGCIAVPAMEYSIGFAKNLFTLKVFKVSDFNNVANLNKNKEKKENKEQQKKVETHSKSVLLKNSLLSVAGLGAGLLLASRGHNSKSALKFSEILLEPGKYISKGLTKLGVNSKKTDEFLKEYLKLDFDNRNGKLALSKGQLAVICTTGLFGYASAAKDRGKLDFYEVWTRVPLVVLYTIFGSSLLDGGFKNLLIKKGKFPELIKKDANGNIAPVPTSKDLPVIAEKLSKLNNTSKDVELAKLIKQKSIITGVPYLFSLVAMGFILSGVTRLWTQYRYNHQQKNNESDTNNFQSNFIKSPAFQGFKIS